MIFKNLAHRFHTVWFGAGFSGRCRSSAAFEDVLPSSSSGVLWLDFMSGLGLGETSRARRLNGFSLAFWHRRTFSPSSPSERQSFSLETVSMRPCSPSFGSGSFGWSGCSLWCAFTPYGARLSFPRSKPAPGGGLFFPSSEPRLSSEFHKGASEEEKEKVAVSNRVFRVKTLA